MKLYESTIKDTIILHSDGTEISYLDVEWSYIISLSIWVPMSILFVLLLSDSFIWSYVIESFRNVLKSFKKTEDKLQRFAIEENVFGEQRQITTVERVPAEEMNEIRQKIDKMHEFSVAFKYLCTCLPGNKILARKAIRITSDTFI